MIKLQADVAEATIKLRDIKADLSFLTSQRKKIDLQLNQAYLTRDQAAIKRLTNELKILT